MARFPKPPQPSDDNPIEMLRWCYQYVLWAWRTITTPPVMQIPTESIVQTGNPLPKWMRVVQKVIWGLSGFFLSLFVTVLMQMYGVDDPVIARFVLGGIFLWLFIMCVYSVFRYSNSRVIRKLGIALPAVVLLIVSIHIDNCFMTKRKLRGRPATVEDLKKEFPWLGHEPQPSGSTASNPEPKPEQKPVAAKAPCRVETLKNCSPKEFRDRVLRLTQNMQNLIDDIESHNKDARRVENSHQDDPASERERIKKEQGIALKFFTETDLNRYRTLYMNSAISYRTELVNRLGPPVDAIPEHFYRPLDWHELNGVVQELRDMANKLEDGN